MKMEYTDAFVPPNLVNSLFSGDRHRQSSINIDNKVPTSSSSSSFQQRFYASDQIEQEGQSPQSPELRRIRAAYLSWCQKFRKQPDETRYQQFVNNFKVMESIARSRGNEIHLNEYADFTAEEYQQVAKRAEAARKQEAARVAAEAKARAEQEAAGILQAEADLAKARAEMLAKRKAAEEDMRRRKEQMELEAAQAAQAQKALVEAEILRKAAEVQRKKALLAEQQQQQQQQIEEEVKKTTETAVESSKNDVGTQSKPTTAATPSTTATSATASPQPTSQQQQQSPVEEIIPKTSVSTSSPQPPTPNANQIQTETPTSTSTPSSSSSSSSTIPSTTEPLNPRAAAQLAMPSSPDNKDPAVMARVRKIYIQWCQKYRKNADTSRFPIFMKRFLLIEKFSKDAGMQVILDEYTDCNEVEYDQVAKRISSQPPVPQQPPPPPTPQQETTSSSNNNVQEQPTPRLETPSTTTDNVQQQQTPSNTVLESSKATAEQERLKQEAELSRWQLLKLLQRRKLSLKNLESNQNSSWPAKK